MIPRTLFLIGIITFLAFPSLASGSGPPWTPLVTCGWPSGCPYPGGACPDCSLCELFHTGQHILAFLIFIIAIPAATIGILIGGVLLLIAGGNEALVSKGRNAMKFAVAGLVVILVSFIVINTILTVIGGVVVDGTAQPRGFPWPWSQLRC